MKVTPSKLLAAVGIPVAALVLSTSLVDGVVAPKRWAFHLLAVGVLLGARLHRGALEKVAVLTALWSGWCAVASPTAGVTLRPWVDQMAALGLLVGVARSRVPRRSLVLGLEVALGVTVVLALVDGWTTLVEWIPVASRPAGPLGSRSVAAEFAAGIVPLVVALRRPTIARRLLLAGAVMLLVATRGRAAWLAAAVALAWAVWRARPQARPRWLAAAGSGLALALLLTPAPRWRWSSSRPYWDSLTSTVQARSWRRALTWENTLQMGLTRPVEGFGAGSFQSAYGPFARSAVVDPSFNVVQQMESPHCEPLRIAVEDGLPGLALVAAIAFGWAYRHRRGPRPMAALGALLVCATVSKTFETPPTLLVGAVVLGLLWRQPRPRRQGRFGVLVALILGVTAIHLDVEEFVALRQWTAAQCDEALGRDAVALDELAAAGERLPSAELDSEAAEAALRLADADRCEQFAEQGLRLWPTLPRLQVEYGRCAASAGHLDVAEQRFQQALSTLPENYLALAGLMEVERWRGHGDEARVTARHLDDVLRRGVPEIPAHRHARELVEARSIREQAEAVLATP